jgi:hypothetical protein
VAVSLLGFLWTFIVLGIAVAKIHQLSGGAAAGVVILTAIIVIVIAIGLAIAFTALLVGLIAAASGGMH